MSSEYNSDCELKRFIVKLFTKFFRMENDPLLVDFSLYIKIVKNRDSRTYLLSLNYYSLAELSNEAIISANSFLNSTFSASSSSSFFLSSSVPFPTKIAPIGRISRLSISASLDLISLARSISLALGC